ncbi:MAG: hypothetical protein Q4B95_03380 [Lonepinella koalarum]|nr:hypothetical protein [Lonepinella koalarum]
MYKSQVIQQEELHNFDMAKQNLWEMYSILEIIQEKLIQDDQTSVLGTALKGVCRGISASIDILEEI